tara:strand:+ start:7007 stop:7192 length:186 start_codon:yes stop_codon:yes gene_type:complete
MNNTVYQCVQLSEFNECSAWQAVPDHSGYKLTNEQMAEFIFSIAVLFATVAAIKLIKRSFF